MQAMIATGAGDIPVVSPEWSWADRFGTAKARLNINRMKYTVSPGLYAVGAPVENSPVFLSANFKLSFDTLRKNLSGIDGWILVLDTKGINVWCAAGKGTFGTAEVIRRIQMSGLDKVVAHRRIIAPQLGAPGIAAHKVKERTGFKILYGPVRAADIPAYLNNRMKADKPMRRVWFTFRDRFTLLPIDASIALKYLIPAMLLFFGLSGLCRWGYSTDLLLSRGIQSALSVLFACAAGILVVPLLLPYLPGTMFSVKGAVAGAAVFILQYLFYPGFAAAGIWYITAWGLMSVGISSFLAMNFTGSSTFTSLSGVKKEMKASIPFQIAFFAAGCIIWLVTLFV